MTKIIKMYYPFVYKFVYLHVTFLQREFIWCFISMHIWSTFAKVDVASLLPLLSRKRYSLKFEFACARAQTYGLFKETARRGYKYAEKAWWRKAYRPKSLVGSPRSFPNATPPRHGSAVTWSTRGGRTERLVRMNDDREHVARFACEIYSPENGAHSGGLYKACRDMSFFRHSRKLWPSRKYPSDKVLFSDVSSVLFELPSLLICWRMIKDNDNWREWAFPNYYYPLPPPPQQSLRVTLLSIRIAFTSPFVSLLLLSESHPLHPVYPESNWITVRRKDVIRLPRFASGRGK